MSARVFLLAAALAACGQPVPSPGRDGRAQPQSFADMPVARAAHGAVALPDGRVLLVGGCVLESCEAGPESAAVDAYDPRSGRIARAGALLERRLSAVVVRLASGRILVAGGWSGPQVSARVELWDPATGRSRGGPQLAAARSDLAAATLADGRVLLAGGFDGDGPVDLVEIFDPSRGKLISAGRLTVARAGAGAAPLPDGRVLIVGGGTGTGAREPTASAEIFDPGTGRSVAVGALAAPRYKHATVVLPDGRVLVFGGSDRRDRNGKIDRVERFEPGIRGFVAAGRLLAPRYKIGGAVVRLPDGKVLIAGGAPRAERYDPQTGVSEFAGPDFGASLNFASATLLADGSVLVAGGYDEDGIRMSRKAWRLR
ncbi:MAG TPA: hypothetical protein VEA61_15920 [Allosphingosinicella sp.]|nr:hypothetical protein [Allosphingosinicella sp.]